MSTKKHKLERCPFCGCEAELRLDEGDYEADYKEWYLGCQDEFCIGLELITTDEADIEEDVQRWNARSEKANAKEGK